MRRALVLTAFDRPEYWAPVCESWGRVDTAGWDVILRLEPSDSGTQEHMKNLFIEFFGDEHRIIVNPERLGVLLHPWVAFESLFLEGYDFVVRAEDDLVVSTDVLRFFESASEVFDGDKSVASVHAFNGTGSTEHHRVDVGPDGFNPWVWGTWADRWREYIGPTWDRDYSTYNGYPGNQSGWDWNLNTRVLPRLGKSVASVAQSRVQNIGAWGVHGTPDNLPVAPDWQQEYEPGEFWTP